MLRRLKIDFHLALICAVLWRAPLLSATVDPYTSEFESQPPERGFTYRQQHLDRMIEARELYRKRINLPDVSTPNAPHASWAVSPIWRRGHAAQIAPPETGLADLLQSCLLAIALAAAAIQSKRKIGPQFANFFRTTLWPSETSAAGVTSLSTRVRADEAAFSEFVSAFRVGVTKPAQAAKAVGETQTTRESGANSTEEFLKWAPAHLATFKALLQDLNRGAICEAREMALSEFAEQVRVLSDKAGRLGLLPVWQTSAALEGLIKQCLHAGNITPSTLRTMASAIDVLDDLCKKQRSATVLNSDSVRLLVVDDDLVNRRAISFALKRAFNQPDLAENGQEALPLVEKQRYDMVFLDVQMPGLDGYEVCSKIHQTTANNSTPVVFVTCHSDFEDRTKSIVSGGCDLIAKPFLSFELTLKALVAVIRKRLQEESAVAGWRRWCRPGAAGRLLSAWEGASA